MALTGKKTTRVPSASWVWFLPFWFGHISHWHMVTHFYLDFQAYEVEMSKCLVSTGLVTETFFDDGGHRVTQMCCVQKKPWNRSLNASPSLFVLRRVVVTLKIDQRQYRGASFWDQKEVWNKHLTLDMDKMTPHQGCVVERKQHCASNSFEARVSKCGLGLQPTSLLWPYWIIQVLTQMQQGDFQCCLSPPSLGLSS